MVIAVINNKGGVGKTTTCVNLAAALAKRDYRILLIDLDSQASASLSLGIGFTDLSPSVADVLFEGAGVEGAIRATSIERLHLLTGGMELAHSDLVLADVPGRESRLAEALAPVRDAYDFIFCDCAPSLSMLPVNAFVAADAYLVPLTPEYLALEGLINLMEAVESLKRGMGMHPKLLGVVFTLAKPTFLGLGGGVTKRHGANMELVREHYGDRVFHTAIALDDALAVAPAHSQSIFEYAPNSKGSRQYAALADEVLERCGEGMAEN